MYLQNYVYQSNNFVPFIVETRGLISAAGLLEFIDKVSGALEGDRQRAGPGGQARGTARVSVSPPRWLFRQQGYMHAGADCHGDRSDLAVAGGCGCWRRWLRAAMDVFGSVCPSLPI